MRAALLLDCSFSVAAPPPPAIVKVAAQASVAREAFRFIAIDAKTAPAYARLGLCEDAARRRAGFTRLKSLSESGATGEARP